MSQAPKAIIHILCHRRPCTGCHPLGAYAERAQALKEAEHFPGAVVIPVPLYDVGAPFTPEAQSSPRPA